MLGFLLGSILLVKPLDPDPSMVQRLISLGGYGQAFRAVTESDPELQWYSLCAPWDSLTLWPGDATLWLNQSIPAEQVMAMTPDQRLVPIWLGKGQARWLDPEDLYRKRCPDGSVGVVLFAAFRQDFRLKDVKAVEIRKRGGR